MHDKIKIFIMNEFLPNMKPTEPCNILGDSAGAPLLKKSDLLILDEGKSS